MTALQLQNNYYPLPIDTKDLNNKNDKDVTRGLVVKKYKVRKRIRTTQKTKDVLYKFIGLPLGIGFLGILFYGFFYIGSECVNYI